MARAILHVLVSARSMQARRAVARMATLALLVVALPHWSLLGEQIAQAGDGVANTERKVESAEDQAAGKEMEIARYYVVRRDYTGAINRCKIVLTRYRNTPHVEEAFKGLTEAYLVLGIIDEARTAAAVLRRKFPDSPWSKEAYDLLKSRGLEPHEDERSWISRAFQ
jgi:Outer membrane lipoprotein